MKNLSLLSLLAIVALLAGCAGDTTVSTTGESVTPEATREPASAEPETVATANKNCPIMGHAVTADGGTFTWNGKTIGFCCEGCKPEFEKLSDEDKTAKLAEADKAGHSDHSDHSDHSGHKEGGEAKPAESTES